MDAEPISSVKPSRKTGWFFNGVLVSVLMMATANGLSYFVRSGSWQPLLDASYNSQALGFPLEIWRRGESYASGALVDQRAMAINAVIAILIGSCIGWWFVSNHRRLDRFMDFMIERELATKSGMTWQFSVAGVFAFTALVAVFFAAVRAALGASPNVLLGIYVLGPTFLVALAMLPSGLTWQSRVLLLAPSTLLMIGFTMYVGTKVGLQFDHVMMGVFVCWVPQTVLAIIVLMVRQWVQFVATKEPSRSERS